MEAFYQQFKDVINELKQLDSEFISRLGLGDVYAVLDDLCIFEVCDMWRALQRSKAANEQAFGSNRKTFFLSLMLHLKEGITKPSGWDELTSRQREKEILGLIKSLKQVLKEMRRLEVKMQNPVAEVLVNYRDNYQSSELTPILMEIRQELAKVSVRRPPISEDDSRAVERLIGWLESDLDDLPHRRSSELGREKNIVPVRGDSKAVTTFVKVMAKWTDKYLGQKSYGSLAYFVYAFMSDHVNPDYDASNVKSIFLSK